MALICHSLSNGVVHSVTRMQRKHSATFPKQRTNRRGNEVKLLYKFETTVGTFFIGQSADGRFHPLFNHKSLGSYAQQWQASEDLAGGHTFSAAGVEDTGGLGIPRDISEWEPIRS